MTCFDFPAAILAHATDRPDHPAVICGDNRIGWGDFSARVDGVAATLAKLGTRPGDVVGAVAASSVDYAVLWAAVLRLRATIAPLAPSSTPDQIAAMVGDSGARLVFTDAAARRDFGAALARVQIVDLDALDAWIDPTAELPPLAPLDPDAAFNIIYSSGTTGTPKGIVQSAAMRSLHITGAKALGYDANSITLLSTPLYSNTTLVSFLPTLAWGGTVVLQPKFDSSEWLKLAERHEATHTMLVPVQYRRLLADPAFDNHRLSLQMKFCTSAPFPGELKAEVLRRMPGGLVEFFGMTEGGVSFVFPAHLHPDKLHTVGRASEGHAVRIIDEDGNDVPAGTPGEIVGQSPATMNGYKNRPDLTDKAFWTAPDGSRWLRTGDIGRIDADGFLTLMDRAKDMIISGGFNIYPSDIEAVLVAQPGVVEAAVVGIASDRWGETPVAFVVAPGADAEALRTAVNAQLGKTQRLAALVLLDELPRSHIGKVLKRELRDGFAGSVA
ncbi:class I adenylate-forming enzyme family protein [Polymorphobacter fuscus]|uniref:AMP-binding protein n=1 Tax=Sandarakinorhabdus fusca TaxID=1439888 RepID=A0A7C9LH76_9SPHN|nr:class I adenylate-forming enzyme family protein [Polymorphobacter fuscus]KAB7645598.1 acyl--CoA ligase [Polymorphobacter fuscus]MQT18047.1 AMP-binding protein [Polymorphobacter fuscus]NJC08680.1 acyl-CoA synthetase (AMP-forming)/AMP-acid ligase II [Polymorphobacter fuscus]